MSTIAAAPVTRRDDPLGATALLARPPADPRRRRRPDGALEAVPPTQDCRCGRRLWERSGGRWRATCCWMTAAIQPPTDAELAQAEAADREFRRRVEAVQESMDANAA